MKKTISVVLTIAMVLLVLAGCRKTESSSAGSAEAIQPSQWKTMADVFPYVDAGEFQESYSETKYVLAVVADGEYYRAAAELPEDVSRALWSIEFDDENRDQKIKDLIGPLEITSLENLTEQMPGQEELNNLVGKTGQELFDDGWTYWYYNLDDMEAGMNYGYFSYVVRFEYDGEPMVNSDDFDFYTSFTDLKVKSVTCEGIGDASGLD